VFQQNCITILNRLSAEEASLLDKLHGFLSKRRLERYTKAVAYYEKAKEKYPGQTKNFPSKPEQYSLDFFTFNVSRLSKEFNIEKSELEFSISNLISLGLLKWETDVDVKATKSSDDPDDTDIDVDVDVSNNDNFIFTSIGDKFVKVCNE
jgi:hypothetical protein